MSLILLHAIISVQLPIFD